MIAIALKICITSFLIFLLMIAASPKDPPAWYCFLGIASFIGSVGGLIAVIWLI